MLGKKATVVIVTTVSSVLLSSCGDTSALLDKDTYMGKEQETSHEKAAVSTTGKDVEQDVAQVSSKALELAQHYVDDDAVSQKKLIEKLEKDIGDDKAIQYALDNVDVDYTQEIQQALKEIEKTTGLSTNDMIDMLVADGFTREMIKTALKEYHLS